MAVNISALTRKFQEEIESSDEYVSNLEDLFVDLNTMVRATDHRHQYQYLVSSFLGNHLNDRFDRHLEERLKLRAEIIERQTEERMKYYDNYKAKMKKKVSSLQVATILLTSTSLQEKAQKEKAKKELAKVANSPSEACSTTPSNFFSTLIALFTETGSPI